MIPIASRYSANTGQLPPPPDKQMYHSDALNLSICTSAPSINDPYVGVRNCRDLNACREDVQETRDDSSECLSQMENSQPSAGNYSEDDAVESGDMELRFTRVTDSHGWLTIGAENIQLPYVVRGDGRRYVPLCILEKTFLYRHPESYGERSSAHLTTLGSYLTTDEVKLLNRFVSQDALHSLGMNRFSLKDNLIAIQDVVDFINRTKSQSSCLPVTVGIQERRVLDTLQGGWSQVNNTVLPYVMRNKVKMVPLCVIRYAANLLNNVDVPSLEATQEECQYLNARCAEEGIHFEFIVNTKLIELFLIPTLSNTRVSIVELPQKEPLQHAKFIFQNRDRRSVFVAASVRHRRLVRRVNKSSNAAPTTLSDVPLEAASSSQIPPPPLLIPTSHSASPELSTSGTTLIQSPVENTVSTVMANTVNSTEIFHSLGLRPQPIVQAITPQQTNVQTITPQQPNVQTITPQPCNVQPITPQPTNVQPITPQQPNVQPITPQQPNVQPITPQQPNVQPITPQQPNVQPITPQKPNVQPITPKQPNVQPIAPQQPNVQPIDLQKLNVQPIAPQQLNIQPIAPQQPNVQPITPQPNVQPITSQQPIVQPITPQRTNVQPITPQQLNVQPINPQQPNVQPITPQQPNVQPIAPQQPNVQPITSQPNVQPITPQQPIVQPITPQQTNVEPITPQQLNVQPITPQQPNVQPITPQQLNVQPITPQQPTIQPITPQQPNVQPITPQRPNVQPVTSDATWLLPQSALIIHLDKPIQPGAPISVVLPSNMVQRFVIQPPQLYEASPDVAIKMKRDLDELEEKDKLEVKRRRTDGGSSEFSSV